MNIFLSYSQFDQDLAKDLQKSIQAKGVDCFRDETHILPGKNIHEEIKASLTRATHLLVLMSPASLKSPWVAYEVGMAEGKHLIVLPFLTHPSLDLPSFLSHIKYFSNKEELMAFLDASHGEQPEPVPFFSGWSSWGGLRATHSAPNEVTFNGSFAGAAGFVKEGNLPWGGKTLKVKITGTARSTFDQMKLCKIEINGSSNIPPGSSANYNDPEYIIQNDCTLLIKLPSRLNKLQFIFWNATLHDLLFQAELE